MAAKRVAKKSKSSPPVQLTHQSEITIASLLARRLKPYAGLAISLTAIGGFLGAVYGGWNWLGGPLLVTDRQMTHAIDAVKQKVGEKIDQVRVSVTSHADKNATEVKEDVSGVKKQVETLSKKSDATRVSVLELQSRTLFMQKTQTQTSLASVESQLRDKPGDIFLMGRKSELTSILQFIDREQSNVADQLRKARGE